MYIMFIPSRNMFGAIICLILLANQLLIHQNDGENVSNSFLTLVYSLYVRTLRKRTLNTFVNRPPGGQGATIVIAHARMYYYATKSVG